MYLIQMVDFFEIIINKVTVLTDMIIKITRFKRRNVMNHQMFEGITAGLTNTYSVLAQASQGKITLSSIAAAQSNSQFANQIEARVLCTPVPEHLSVGRAAHSYAREILLGVELA